MPMMFGGYSTIMVGKVYKAAGERWAAKGEEPWWWVEIRLLQLRGLFFCPSQETEETHYPSTWSRGVSLSS